MSPFPLGLFGYLARIRQNRAVSFMMILFAFFLVLSILAHSPGLLQLDQRVTRGFQRLRNDPLDRFVRIITVFADPVTLIAFGIVGTLAFWLLGRPWAGIFCGLSVLGMPLNYAIKQIIRRPRPDAAVVKVLIPVVGRSFPSGHAMTAIMFYGLLAFLVWIHVHHGMWRGVLTAVLVFLALGIGLSRVYLGVHWFSDVLGGWTAGLFFLVILALLYKTASGPAELAGR
jgi:undecaprenyl-diphosphatase